MGAEERALRAIEVTRSTISKALLDPMTLVAMRAGDVTPESLEGLVEELLEYLDKTRGETE